MQENENADHLDVLAASCLLLARVASSLTTDERRTLAPSVSELTGALAALPGGLGDRETRQTAADRAFEVATAVAGSNATPDSALAAGVVAVRVLAIDVMVFAGVEFDAAAAAVREGILEHRVPPPAPRPGGLVGWLRSLRPSDLRRLVRGRAEARRSE